MAAGDYTTECGSDPLSWMQMLASTIVGYHDIGGVMHYRLNVLEYPDSCSELTDFLTCPFSHIEHERLLVENVFRLDECGTYLALELFSNSDNDFVNYSECGEMPQSLIDMLAHCIYTYSGYEMLNAVLETAECTEATQLLSCTLNEIESERLIVSNVFSVDDCGNRLIKFFINQSTMTDYNTACTEAPETFMQLLARCVVLYDGAYYINVASVSGDCDDLHAFWTCSNNHITPERALAENVFATDSCGNLALKINYNQGGRQ